MLVPPGRIGVSTIPDQDPQRKLPRNDATTATIRGFCHCIVPTVRVNSSRIVEAVADGDILTTIPAPKIDSASIALVDSNKRYECSRHAPSSSYLYLSQCLPICEMAKKTLLDFAEEHNKPVAPVVTCDLSGKTVVITGANAGIGFEAAKHFALMKPARLIIVCRNQERGEKAVNGEQICRSWTFSNCSPNGRN